MLSLVTQVGIGGGLVAVTVGAAVLGLLIGSFVNVVAYRVPRGLSVVRPGSACPACGTPIRGFDNVPVLSWLVLRARCRHCGGHISARYPLVELATGVVFGLVAWGLGPHWAVPGMCALAATVLTLALVEADGFPGPGGVSAIGSVLGVALLAAAAAADGREARLVGMLAGAALGAAVPVLTWISARRRRAGGRVLSWPLLPAGAVWGWAGLPGGAVGPAVALGVLVMAAAAARDRAGRGAQRRAVVAAAVAVGVTAGLVAAVAAGGAVGR